MSIADQLRDLCEYYEPNSLGVELLNQAADHIDALEAQVKALKNGHATKGRPTLEEMKLHGAKIGLPDSEAEKCFYYYQSNGWKVGRNPMKCWRSAMINWRKNWQAQRIQGKWIGLGQSPQQQGTILDKEIAAVQRALK